jgi:carbohydrate kinase (thermoresistant glucokinase family)
MSKIIVVMGVSGCGKSAVGSELAASLGLPFYDADDFHPTSNIEKMQSGTPLTDQDRYPWLQRLATEIQAWEKVGGAVLACSALKEEYRQILSAKTQIQWVCLTAPFEVIYQRMKKRNHFMEPELLRSQFDTLEVPNYGIQLANEQSVAGTVTKILSLLKQHEAE